MARPAAAISQWANMLASTAAVGRKRCPAGGVAQAVVHAGPTWTAALAGDVHGRQFRTRKKGGFAVGATKRGKGTKWMVLVDGQGIPLGALLASASPHESTLAEATLAQVKVPRPRGRPRTKPVRIVADKAYDSDPLRHRLKKRGIELIAPYRCYKRKKPHQDGRKLRRYKRRWKVERTNAWLGNYRRLVVRYDRLLSVYQGFFHVACLMITVRHF